MRTRKEVLEYGFSFSGTYQDVPFYDSNLKLLMCQRQIILQSG